MDFDWSLSHFLDAANEVLSKRKTFLNFNPRIYYDVYILVILFKSCVAGYGMLKVIPRQATYTFLCVQLFLHFLIRDEECCIREMYNFIGQAGMRIAIHGIEGQIEAYVLTSLNVLTWFFNSRFTPSEFFLDCYFSFVVLYYIWKSYRTRLHTLSTLMCVLLFVNWMTDYFSSKEPTDTLTSMIFFYVPLVFMDSFTTTERLHVLPSAVGAMWVIRKLHNTDLQKAPAGRFVESLHIDDWTFEDYVDAVGKRKSFLNVDETEHCGIFYTLLLLKSFIASYVVRYVIGVFPTLRLLFINFLFSMCDGNVRAISSSFIRFVFMSLYQYVLHMQKYRLSLSAGIWYFVGCDNHFHFLLDFYLVIAAIVYIDNAYRNNERIYSLFWFLYFIDWFANQYIGEPFTVIETIVTFYLPVALLASCSTISVRTRVFSMLVYIALWLVYKHEKYNIEYGVNKCILNFYEIARTLVENITDVLFEG